MCAVLWIVFASKCRTFHRVRMVKQWAQMPLSIQRAGLQKVPCRLRAHPDHRLPLAHTLQLIEDSRADHNFKTAAENSPCSQKPRSDTHILPDLHHKLRSCNCYNILPGYNQTFALLRTHLRARDWLLESIETLPLISMAHLFWSNYSPLIHGTDRHVQLV